MSVGCANTLQVLPTFPLVLSNEILEGLAPILGMGQYHSPVHAEQFINMIQPMKPYGIICCTMKVADIIDKAKGTLYIIHCECTFEK